MDRRRQTDRSRWESAPQRHAHHSGMYPQDERRAWIPGSAPEQVPYRSAQSPQQEAEFDAEYRQWREEQLRLFDEDYRHWRKERYRKFSEEFDAWRRTRQTAQDAGVARAQSIGNGQGGGAGGFGSGTIGGGAAPDAGAHGDSRAGVPTDVGLVKGG
jgi:hypothetical protein